MKVAALVSSSIILFSSLFAEERFSAEVDYLLFQAHQDGLFRASEFVLTGQNGGVTGIQGKDKYVQDGHWNSGVRVKLGWEPECRPWNLGLQYTYLGNHLSSPKLTGVTLASGSTVNNALFTDYATNFLASDTVYTNQASWKFCFNQIDLLIEQPFCLGEGSQFTPYLGLRGLDLLQTADFSFEDDISRNRTSFHPQFAGIGLTAGFAGRFELGYGIDLWGRFGGGLMWGRFKTDQWLKATLIRTGSSSLEENDHIFWGTSLNVDTALGIEWSMPLNEGCQWLVLTFAWENHLYTKTNHAQNFIGQELMLDVDNGLTLDRNLSRGDFSLQGFSLGAAYLF